MSYSLIKPLLFSMNPEAAHDLTLKLAKLSPTLGKISGRSSHPRLAVKVGSITWSSPIGLAAGLDKNAEALSFFEAQGFGAIECGTVTFEPQLGNPKPRLWRYPEEESLRNAMGFPNQGMKQILPRVNAFQGGIPLGVNLGKNKESDREGSLKELSSMTKAFDQDADYFVINVSSPNTPGLRAYQEKSYLTELFTLLKQKTSKDLYLKLAPDLEPEKVSELTELAHDLRLTGLIATNTTIIPERGIGGVSGKLLTKKAHSIRSQILKQKDSHLELIGVGGISNAQDLFQHWYEGGKVVQIYTSYVFQGPDILKNFQKDILRFLDQEKIYHLEDFFKLPLAERQKRLSRVLLAT